MRCQRCPQAARVVADKAGPDGRPMSRELLCLACSRRHVDGKPVYDVVVDDRDFAQVLASDTCWCEPSARLGVAIRWCPRHGQILETKTATNKE